MVAENPTWASPRIHSELLMLSLDISERRLPLGETSIETLDWGRERPAKGFVPGLQVAYFLTCDWADCTTVTIGLLDPCGLVPKEHAQTLSLDITAAQQSRHRGAWFNSRVVFRRHNGESRRFQR